VATPLAVLLQAAGKPAGGSVAGKPARLVDYRSVLTPRELDAPAAETAALTAAAAVHDLGWLRRIAVRGEDRFRWLSGMVTNTVNDLGSNSGAWNLVLNAQGRIQGDLTVWREEDSIEIEMEASQMDRLLAHLERFIIMDDVELVPLGLDPATAETALGLTGPSASEVLARMGLPVLAEAMTATRVEWNGLDLRILRTYGAIAEHYEIWLPAHGVGKLWRMITTGGASPVGSAALDALRVAEGIPAYGIDIVERDLPQETSQMRALHFNKGCYLGQEIVERIRSRGNVHRHLLQLEIDGPLPAAGTELNLRAEGTESNLQGAPAGNITSAAQLPGAAASRTFALGMIRGEAETRGEPLTYTTPEGAGAARILSSAPTF
jgi:folate-binding protein YgfZ